MVKSVMAHRRLGFTLLELLVVVAIILIVTTLTLMAYRGIASDMRMSAAVQDVTNVMEQARSRAIRDGKTTMVALRPRLTSGGEHIWRQTRASTTTRPPHAVGKLLHVIIPPPTSCFFLLLSR